MSFVALGVGLPKTGTSSLAKALQKAGINAFHQRFRKDYPHVGELMLGAWEEGLPIDEYVGGMVEAVTQLDTLREGKNIWPQLCHEFLCAFVKQHPEAVIILHVRDPKKTLNSIKRWKDLRTRIEKAPGLRPGCSDKAVIGWIENHYANMRRLFSHNSRYVEFDIEDDPERIKTALSIALGRDLPWWGVENANPE